MAFTFDLEAAINAIAAQERAIPDIITSHDYGANPVEAGPPNLMPEVVHVPLGPQMATEGVIPGLHTIGGSFNVSYSIYSRVLLIESVPDNYPADEFAVGVIWQPIVNSFANLDNMKSLAQAGGAHTYSFAFTDPSYQVSPWPPDPASLKWFWALDYVHTFYFIG